MLGSARVKFDFIFFSHVLMLPHNKNGNWVSWFKFQQVMIFKLIIKFLLTVNETLTSSVLYF